MYEKIPEFPNEAKPGNPVTAIDLHTVQGVTLRYTFETPVQQAQMFQFLGILFARITDVMPELSLPAEADIELLKAAKVGLQWITYDRDSYPAKDSPMVVFAGDANGTRYKSIAFIEAAIAEAERHLERQEEGGNVNGLT